MFQPGASQQQPPIPQGDGGAPAPAGDGLRHYELHEDEGGGFHSVYTGPDGQAEHGDHATFDEAQASMDSCFGQGGNETAQPDDDFADGGSENIAGAYGRKASQ